MAEIFREPTPEVAFGQVTSVYRKRREMSQKDLAEKLTELGMKVDASAVSRLESGGRTLKLWEAFKVAEALDVSLDTLLSFASTPASILRDARDRLDASWHGVRSEVVGFLHNLAEVKDHLAHHPELLAGLKDKEFGTPKSSEEYVDWVLKRLVRVSAELKADGEIDYGNTFMVSSEDERRASVELIMAMVSTFVDIGEYPDDELTESDDGEHSEEA
ncbi:helix-turn-helix domain-containing protein [Leucobacter sp. W1153]|uniref:helix-turn-helix domain-containing protein n=1 Tax=Leucobacter sp. W1153 TaxID=3439064 RepID=UPI003F30FC6B